MAILRIQNLTKDYKMGFWGKRHRALDELNRKSMVRSLDFGTQWGRKTTTIKFYCGSFSHLRTAWLLDQERKPFSITKLVTCLKTLFLPISDGKKSFCLYARLAGLPHEDAIKSRTPAGRWD